MRKKTLIVSVDRLEGSIAVLESDDGHTYEVPLISFKVKPREGMIYRVPVAKQPQWAKAEPDPEETERRTGELGNRMTRLTKEDAGGDVEL